MKRHSLTAIVAKAQALTIRCLRTGYKSNISRITRAAVNEILKLQAGEEMDKLADRTKARLDMEEFAENLLKRTKP